MAVLVAAVITAFVISFMIVPVIIKYSLQKNLFDIPGRRKIHKRITPSMGGIAIFLGFFISSLIWIELQEWHKVKFILVPLSIIFLIGVRDDIVPFRAFAKLFGQIVAVGLFIFLSDLRLRSFYGLFDQFEIDVVTSYILTTVTIIVITNSFNLIDGLDGLAGMIASIALLCFGTWFFIVGDQLFAILCFSMLGGVMAFLIFNWEPSEIFMGDTGALVLGMTLAIMCIHFINTNFHLSTSNPYRFEASIATAACFIMIPLIDTSRIIILRLWKRQSPFKPDKSHIHHAIMRLGKSHSQTTLILGITHLLFVAIAVIAIDLGEKVVLSIVIGLAILLSFALDRLILKKL